MKLGRAYRIVPGNIGALLLHMGLISIVAAEVIASQSGAADPQSMDRAMSPYGKGDAFSMNVPDNGGKAPLLVGAGDDADESITDGAPDAEKEIGEAGSDSPGDGGGEGIHRIKGFVQCDNYFGTESGGDVSGVFQKNELRNTTEYRLGSADQHLQAKGSLFLLAHVFSNDVNSQYIYSDRFRVDRNGRLTSPSAELCFSELYVNSEFGIVRMRAGNQIYSWGTTDAFNPTAYFNPYDLREFLFKDPEDMKIGVPSVSALITVGEYSIEIVIVPFHVPIVLPEPGNFWGLRYKEGPFPVTVDRPGAMDVSFEGTGAGAQFYMNWLDTDIYASLYRGPDREPVLRPSRTVIVPNRPVSLLVVPEYHPLTSLGLAFSRPVDKFILQAEFAYSPDRTGVVEQPYTKDLELPFSLRKGHYFSYSAGCNYLVPLGDLFPWHDGDAVFTVEWMQSRYADGELMRPLFTDILVVQFRDSFFDNRLQASITAIADIADDSWSVLPRVSYRFKNDITVAVSYVFIASREGSFLGYYDDNDGLAVKVRYDY